MIPSTAFAAQWPPGGGINYVRETKTRLGTEILGSMIVITNDAEELP